MNIEITEVFSVTTCVNCGMQFAVAYHWLSEKRNNHKSFYCPNGHVLSYPSESGEEKARRLQAKAELEAQAKINSEKHLRLVAELERDKAIKAKRKIEKRISKGVCPCCNRTFEDLARHMGSKHKDYALPPGSEKRIHGTVQ